MAPTLKKSRPKSVSASLGTPSQHSQPSRHGKRAWRKHVDIGDVEEGLEGLRDEERVTGSILQKKTNDDLFQIDLTGDEKVRKSLPRFSNSQLMSAKILAQRSAVPPVFSRPSSASSKKLRSSVSHEDKVRLLRIGKRKRLGPLNSFMDPTELGSSIMEPSHAVKASGTYDVWAYDSDFMKGVDDVPEKREILAPLVKKIKPKAPQTPNPRLAIEVPAVLEPHQGASYNPPVHSHQELLLIAHEIAKRKEKADERFAGVKEAMDAARRRVRDADEGVPLGMTIDDAALNDDEAVEGTEGVSKPAKLPVRKTKQQRQKAIRLRAEKRALAERVAKKRLLVSIHAIKSMRSSFEKTISSRQQARAEKQLALARRLRKAGLAGTRLGKHQVKDRDVEVQLGEELSESLRALKPEGNLFRDRFLSLQHRALVEPRVPVLPKRRRLQVKEVEKHAWKRFE